jgi:hypothetical protein
VGVVGAVFVLFGPSPCRRASSAFRGGPFGGEGFADQRLDEFGDGAGVGVVGAERGAGGGVEAAFEEGAEDGGVDGAPVHVGGGAVQGVRGRRR